MTFLEQQNTVPPYIYRYLAAKGGRSRTALEIAERSGLSVRTIKRMSKRKTWDNITIGCAERYIRGCGFELGRIGPVMKRVRAIQKHGVSGLKHFQIKEGTPLWRKGSVTAQLQSLARTLAT